MDKITIYSDGSSRGNPGPGGFGTYLEYVDANGRAYNLEISEGYRLTTNNRMELLGVIKGLEALKRPCDVEVISDSRYVVDAFNKHWIDGWSKKNFMKGTTPVPNADLWKRLLEAMKPHCVRYTWVKGHAGHPENERCDYLATSAADDVANLKTDTEYEKVRSMTSEDD